MTRDETRDERLSVSDRQQLFPQTLVLHHQKSDSDLIWLPSRYFTRLFWLVCGLQRSEDDRVGRIQRVIVTRF